MDNVPPLLAPHVAPPPPLSGEAKALIVLCHLSGLLGVALILPLIVYLIKKEEGGPVARQAKEALNFHLSLLLYGILMIPLLFLGVGFLLYPVLVFGALVLAVVAAVKAADGAAYRYPFCIRFIS